MACSPGMGRPSLPSRLLGWRFVHRHHGQTIEDQPPESREAGDVCETERGRRPGGAEGIRERQPVHVRLRGWRIVVELDEEGAVQVDVGPALGNSISIVMRDPAREPVLLSRY